MKAELKTLISEIMYQTMHAPKSRNLSVEQKKDAYRFNQDFSPIYRAYASAEDIAHLAYELAFSFEDKVSLLLKSGAWVEHSARKLKTSTGLEVFSLIANPADSSLKISFAGTHSLEGLGRDLEVEGPGAESIKANKQALIKTLEKQISNHPQKPVELSLYGHSLGGSDSEHLLAFLLESLAEGGFENLKSIHLHTFNSPGISRQIANQSIQNLARIKEQRPDFEVKIFHAKSEHDFIQQTAEDHVLSRASADLAEVNLLKMNKTKHISKETTPSNWFSNLDEIWANIQKFFSAHQLNGFFTPDRHGKMTNKNHFSLLQNSDLAQTHKIQEDLAHKSSFTVKIARLALEFIRQLLESYIQAPELKYFGVTTGLNFQKTLDYRNRQDLKGIADKHDLNETSKVLKVR